MRSVQLDELLKLSDDSLKKLKLTEMGDWLCNLQLQCSANAGLSVEEAMQSIEKTREIFKRFNRVLPIRFVSEKKIDDTKAMILAHRK